MIQALVSAAATPSRAPMFLAPSGGGKPYAAVWRLADGLAFSLEKEGRLRMVAIFEGDTRRTLLEIECEGEGTHDQVVKALAALPARLAEIESEGLCWEETGTGPDPRLVHRDWVSRAERLVGAHVIRDIPSQEQIEQADSRIEPAPVEGLKRAI